MIPCLLHLFSFSLLPYFLIYAVLAIIYLSSKYYKDTGETNFRGPPKVFCEICLSNLSDNT